MAITTIRSVDLLERGHVLAPERYDPRRSVSAGDGFVMLRSLAVLSRDVVPPGKRVGRCLVLDTCDAREGIVVSRGEPGDLGAIGSAKKIIRAGDVIISRLRPYLRQVAWVDDAIPRARDAELVASTEFFVLRPVGEQSIAFLVPFLLSRAIQEILAASQEGGHHPRFSDTTLSTLPIPRPLVDARDETSAAVERAVTLYRESECLISTAVRRAVADQGV